MSGDALPRVLLFAGRIATAGDRAPIYIIAFATFILLLGLGMTPLPGGSGEAFVSRCELFQSLITHSGRQHAKFGVRPAQYAAFGEALIWSFERQLGAAFTPELREAWRALYDVVQEQMLRAGDHQPNEAQD
jgi:hypothetical protein